MVWGRSVIVKIRVNKDLLPPDPKEKKPGIFFRTNLGFFMVTLKTIYIYTLCIEMFALSIYIPR